MSGKHAITAIGMAIGGFVLGIAFFAAVMLTAIALFFRQFGFDLPV